jgi:hypothetical protein
MTSYEEGFFSGGKPITGIVCTPTDLTRGVLALLVPRNEEVPAERARLDTVTPDTISSFLWRSPRLLAKPQGPPPPPPALDSVSASMPTEEGTSD